MFLWDVRAERALFPHNYLIIFYFQLHHGKLSSLQNV
jgi:hypothetical protein